MDVGQISVYHLALLIRGDIIVAGNLVEDILVRPVERIEYGFTVWVDSIEQHLGGNGANTSYTLATLGIPVRLRGAVGRDDFGDRVLARLRGAGVNTGRGRTDAARRRRRLWCWWLRMGRGRFCILRASAARFFRRRESFEQGPGHFHLANIFSLPKMRRTGAETLARATAAGWTTSLDTGHDTRGEWMGVLEPCLHHIGVLFANEAEALKISGCADVRAAARLFLSRGVKPW